MPKATLSFKLPEEQGEFESASNGGKWARICWELHLHLRSRLKYEELAPEAREVLDAAHSRLFELVTDEGLEL